MSLKENEGISSVPSDDRKECDYSIAKNKAKYSRANRFGKSSSIDIPDGNTLHLQRTKEAFEALETESKSSIPRHLRKTISVGGINQPSTSKVVLRRWTSLLNEKKEEDLTKRHSSSSLLEGSRGEKIVFRPVSTILLSTPWEKDFKVCANKSESDTSKKTVDTVASSNKRDTSVESLVNPNSCAINKHEGPKLFSPGNVIKNFGLSSSRGTTEKFQVSNNRRDQTQVNIGPTVCSSEGYTRNEVNGLLPSREAGKANYVLNTCTAIPQRGDYNQQIDKDNIYQDRNSVTTSDFHSEECSPEDMSLSTGSYYYKSKYGTDLTSAEPSSFRKGNPSAYTRRIPDTSFTTAFKIGRTLNADKSGKETVAEVDAYISAYKSRRERSFEYGETGYQAYVPTKTERKSSLEKSSPPFQSQATRTFSSAYKPSYTSHYQTSSNVYPRTVEKEYNSSKTSRYKTKTDRSKSFDVEPIAYSSLTRTGSGGRYPRRSGSSSSSSRTYSPPEREVYDYPHGSELVSPKVGGTGSILSSDALTPSEKAFFTTSKITETLPVRSISNSYRKSSLDSSKLNSSYVKETPKQRPLSLIGNLPRTASSGPEKPYRKSAIFSTNNDTELSSRSRIMGGILSRFFTEEEPPTEAGAPTDSSVQENSTAVSTSLFDAAEKDDVFTSESKDFDSAYSEKIINRNVQHPHGDSSDILEASPLMMSEDSNHSVSKGGQMVRVRSVFVEEGDTVAMGKNKSQNTAENTKMKSIDGAKDSKETKDLEITQQPRERRSSWIGRSFRKLSSSKSTSEEPLEKTEKPKRERRRSLLWRLGRESKSTEAAGSVAEERSVSEEITVTSSIDKKEEKKGGKKEDKKGERREEKREEKKEDKGITSYLRRSSRRKKSQVSEREILEARQEAHVKSHEEHNVIATEIPTNSAEISQSEIDLGRRDTTEKHDVQVRDKLYKAPLAQAEDSDEDMASVNVRRSKFSEMLHKKEEAAKEEAAKEAAKESQRTDAMSKRVDSEPKKAGTKTTSSYLSSKFMKSRTMFEGGKEKASIEPKREASKPGLRRFTQEPADLKERNQSSKAEIGKDRYKPVINEKRSLFQRARTSDVPTSSDMGRVPLRERNKELRTKKLATKETAPKDALSSDSDNKDSSVSSKVPVRRLVSDSVVKLRSKDRDEGVKIARNRVDRDMQISEEEKRISYGDKKTSRDKKGVFETTESRKTEGRKMEEHDTSVNNEKSNDGESQEPEIKNVAANEAYDSGSSRKPLRMRLQQSLSAGRKSDLKNEKDVLDDEKKQEVTDSAKERDEIISESEQKLKEIKSDKEDARLEKNFDEEVGTDLKDVTFKGTPTSDALLSECRPDIEKASDNLSATDIPDEEKVGNDLSGERMGSRRRRERRAHRAKQVDPLEIERVKEQMRRDSTVNNQGEVSKEEKSSEDASSNRKEKSGKEDQGMGVEDISLPNSKLTERVEEKEEKSKNTGDLVNDSETGNADEIADKPVEQRKYSSNGVRAVDGKLTETDTGDESTGSTGSATKITTRSVIKDKIKQKKIDKMLRKERTMSLPVGVEVVITPISEKKPEFDIKINGTRSPVLRTKPPMVPKIRSQEADDVSKLKKNTKRPLRSRPKTLTQGIDPSLLVSDIKAKEEAVVVEERLSISQLKQKLMESESGSRTPRTPDVQRKNKRRSGKRYKTITEGIAPGLLEAAQQFANNEQDTSKLGVEQMNRLNVALSASTENLKRRSFIVSEVNSRIGSLGTSLATSMEDLSMKENGHDGETKGGSVVEESIKKLKKLPMVVDSDEDDPMPSVSSLKQKFLQAVEDSYKPVKSKVTRRAKGRQRDRPFTISGIDDITMMQLQHNIDERHERNSMETGNTFGSIDVKIEVGKTEKVDELAEDELENMLKAEGLTADQLASQLGINPSLAQGSPLRARKPFLGTTTEETASDVLEVIHEASEKQDRQEAKDNRPLGELRNKFMDAVNEFKSGSSDKGANKETNEEGENETVSGRKERRLGVVGTVDVASEVIAEESEPKSDLDFVSQNVTQLQSITDRRHLKPQRKQRSSANPVKTLQARSDLITEVGSNDKTEKKDVPLGGGTKSAGLKLWRKVALANEAKAALQSTEDFSKVKLKKVKTPGSSANGEPAETGGVVESSITNLLLQIKGRRHVQIHVVEFNTDLLSNDDSYVIVTPRELLCWHGQNANVIEKAKAAEIASRINQKKEMGCKAFDVVYFEQDGQNDSKVFRTLGSQGKVDIKDGIEDDEEYERRMMNSSMAYSLQDSDPPELVPVYDMCQRSPSKEILKTDEAFVFDFLSEVYVWIGRQTTSGLRKKIMKLGREKFDQGYYKPPSATTPIHHGKSRKISLTATELPTRKQSINRKLSVHKFLQDKENLVPRPSCAIFLSMFEGAEWVIFKEKFSDWPDESRIIRMKGGPQTVGELTKTVNVSDVKPVDPQTMLTAGYEPRLPTFEGTEIDRGQGKPKGPDGYHIITRCVQVWHVTERSRTLLPETSNGQFHSGEGYVIRWEYSIVASRVMKMLKDMEEAKASGRHRCAYFFWLGNDCAVTEQGATAVMTVDLDEERGPHVRVIQGKEPPCFLNLFDGGMVIHAGKRKSKLDRATFSDRSVVRLYCIRNEVPSEACLLQVPVCASSLRSRASFVLVLCKQGEIFLWHGCKSSDATRATAIQAAHRLIENHPEEGLLAEKDQIYLTEIDEGQEPEVFWVALGGEDDYGSLLTDLNTKWDFVPRCFHLTSATGQFIANEIINPSINPKEVCPFPFLQDDLYDAYQPAIFIIDATHEVYLWLGWWPEDEDSENSDALRMRWDVDKRKAMESVVLYAKEAGRSLSHCYVVDAGLEPEQFTHLFPYWIVQEDITEIQIEDGRDDSDKLHLITKKLEGFTREFFSIDELVERPLPEGVNPSKLETYLSDEDFMTVFSMTRDEFKKLPLWRRDNLKRDVGLY